MNALAEKKTAGTEAPVELATFYVGELLIGADIRQVEEINRHLDLTPVPHAPAIVRGVINLRGEVVTVIDLRTVLGLGETRIDKSTRNIVVNSKEEQIGLLVDRIADVVRMQSERLERPPANVHGVEGRFFTGVYKMDTELLAVLDVEAVLAADQDDSR
jgi:purine-binding chemotaxis protein CheW